jgi:MFS family permease
MKSNQLHGLRRSSSILMRSEKKTALQSFREDLVRIAEKSQDNFESQLSYIAAGTIGVTIAFVSDIVPIDRAKYIIFLLIGWLLLAACLFINLYSHIVSFRNHRQTISDIDKKNYDPDVATRRNKIINRWNLGSLWTLITGIIGILLFISINMIIMAKEVKVIPQNPSTERKGRESVTPPPPKQTPLPTSPYPGKHGRETPTPPPGTKQ